MPVRTSNTVKIGHPSNLQMLPSGISLTVVLHRIEVQDRQSHLRLLRPWHWRAQDGGVVISNGHEDE